MLTFDLLWKDACCRDCKTPLEKPDAEAQAEAVERHLRMQVTNPGLEAQMRSTYENRLCALCAHELTRRVRRETRRNRAISAYYASILPSEAASAKWKHSDPSIEAMNPAVFSELKNWNRKHSLWLYGPPGTGKTWAALALLNVTIRCGKTAAAIGGAEFMGRAASFDWLSELQPYTEAGVLLLDDLCKGIRTARTFDALWYVIDRRHAAGSHTIITTNQHMATLKRRWAEFSEPSMLTSFFDRLLPAKSYEFQGASVRRRKQKEQTNGA